MNTKTKALKKVKDVTLGKDSPWTEGYGKKLKKQGYKTRLLGGGAIATQDKK